MTDDDDSIETRVRLQAALAAIEAFMASPAHEYYVRARQEEIDRLRGEIITLDPVTREDEIESFKMRGDLRTTESFLSLFQENAESLKDRIEQLLDREQPISNNTNDNDY